MYCEQPQLTITESGYWINFRNYSRLVLCSQDEAAEAVRTMNAVNALKQIQSSKDNHQNRTKTVVYRDAEGKINIPPDPKMIPSGCERIEIKSLADADRVTRELQTELAEKWSYDSTEDMDRMLADRNGNTPIEWLRKYGAKTAKGREIVNIMIEELEREASNRNEVRTNTFFRWREFDHPER
jgi:hypothetical protein